MLSFFWLCLGFQTLVSARELGRWTAARALGLRVVSVSLGYGRPIWSRHTPWMGSTLQVGWIPLGGWIQVEGEAGSRFAPASGLQALPTGRQVAFWLAGPVSSTIMALGLTWAAMGPALGPWEGLLASLAGVCRAAWGMLTGLAGLLAGRLPGEMVGGPVPLAPRGLQFGAWSALALGLAAGSLDLAVLNLLPIPPLDGWRVMTLAGERWANWRIGDRWRTRLVVAGVGFLVAAGLALGVSLVRP